MCVKREVLQVLMVIGVLLLCGSPTVVGAAPPTPTVEENVQTMMAMMLQMMTRIEELEQRIATLEAAQGSLPKPVSPPEEATPREQTPEPIPSGEKEVGEAWEKDGVSLKLASFEVGGAATLKLCFELVNNTGVQINTVFDGHKISATDSMGSRYKNPAQWGGGGASVTVHPLTLRNGQRSEDCVVFSLPLADQSIEFITIEASVSRIENAKWRIPIFH